MKIRAWDGLDAYNNHSIEEVSKNDLCSQHDDLATRDATARLHHLVIFFHCSGLLNKFINTHF